MSYWTGKSESRRLAHDVWFTLAVFRGESIISLRTEQEETRKRGSERRKKVLSFKLLGPLSPLTLAPFLFLSLSPYFLFSLTTHTWPLALQLNVQLRR